MKTAKEINDAIKEEEKRLQICKWAICLIDVTSETMCSQLITSKKIQIDVSRKDDFETAWSQKEVLQCLEDNGLAISRQGFDFYLKVK